MPILGMIAPILGNWRVWIAAAFGILLIVAYALYERGNAAVARLEAFTAQVEAVGQQAIARNKEIERGYKQKMDSAVAGRADALKRLQLAQARSGGSVLPSNTGAAESGSRICFDRTKLDGALQRFIGEAAGIAQGGDIAVIDARALIQAWPR
jgi:hypothetical protein